MDSIGLLSSSQKPTKTYKRGRQAQRRRQSRSSPVNDAPQSSTQLASSSKKRARTRSRDCPLQHDAQLDENATRKPPKRSRKFVDDGRAALTPISDNKKRARRQSTTNINEVPSTETRLDDLDSQLLRDFVRDTSLLPLDQELPSMPSLPMSLTIQDQEVDMDIILSPLPIAMSNASPPMSVTTSAHQKENRSSLLGTPLRSPFRQTITRKAGHKSSPTVVNAQSGVALKPAFMRRGSAVDQLERRPSSAFHRRPSGSHVLDKSKPPQDRPFEPYRDPTSTSESRDSIFSSHSSLSSAFNQHVPQAASSPPGRLRNLSDSSFYIDIPETFSTPVSGRVAFITPPTTGLDLQTPRIVRHQASESPTPRPQYNKTHLRVRLPEDSIFTASLELSVSPTVKQPLADVASPITPTTQLPLEHHHPYVGTVYRNLYRHILHRHILQYTGTPQRAKTIAGKIRKHAGNENS